MQPLTLALGGAICMRVESQCGINTHAPEAAKNTGGSKSVAVMSSCSRTGFVRRNFRPKGEPHAVIASFPSKRRSFKAAAASEGETADVLILDTEPEPKQEAAAGEEIVAPEEGSSPKSNVKFTLHKQCHFGQQFNVVGEIPELGEWDPSQAVPMVWSEGHVWTAEVPIPVGLTVAYKFVMTGRRLELVWQPGENKVFETKDESEMTIFGVWDEYITEESLPTKTSEDVKETEDVQETADERAPSTNGVATASVDSDLEKAVVSGTEEEIPTNETLGSADSLIADESEQEEEPAESPEIPVVDAVLVTAVAEVRGEVKDATAAEI